MERDRRKNNPESSHFSETLNKVKQAVRRFIGVGVIAATGLYCGPKIYEKLSEKDPYLSLFQESGVAEGSIVPIIDGSIVFEKGSFDRPVVIDVSLSDDTKQIILGTRSEGVVGHGSEDRLDITQVTNITPEGFAEGPIIFTNGEGASVEVVDFESFLALLANNTKTVGIVEESDVLTGEEYFVSTDGSAISNHSLAEDKAMSNYEEYLELLKKQKNVFDEGYRQLSESDKKDLVPLKAKDGWPKIFDGIASIPIGTEIISNGQKAKSQAVIIVANPVIDQDNGMMFTNNDGEELSLSRIASGNLSGVSFVRNGAGESQGILAVLGSDALRDGTIFAKRGDVRVLYVNNGNQAIGSVLVDSLRLEAMIKIRVPGDESQVLTYYRANIRPQSIKK